MTINFEILDFIHSPSKYYGANNDNTTTYQVAIDLEDRYNVMLKFIKSRETEIINILTKELTLAINKARKINDNIISEGIKNLWRNYMIRGEHGITSQRSRETGGVALIDTGEYYKSLIIRIDNG